MCGARGAFAAKGKTSCVAASLRARPVVCVCGSVMCVRCACLCSVYARARVLTVRCMRRCYCLLARVYVDDNVGFEFVIVECVDISRLSIMCLICASVRRRGECLSWRSHTHANDTRAGKAKIFTALWSGVWQNNTGPGSIVFLSNRDQCVAVAHRNFRGRTPRNATAHPPQLFLLFSSVAEAMRIITSTVGAEPGLRLLRTSAEIIVGWPVRHLRYATFTRQIYDHDCFSFYHERCNAIRTRTHTHGTRRGWLTCFVGTRAELCCVLTLRAVEAGSRPDWYLSE